MEDPIYANENRFWDQVTDWLVETHAQTMAWPALPPSEDFPPNVRDSHDPFS